VTLNRKPRQPTITQRARIRRGSMLPELGHTLSFPCGHSRVFPSIDMPEREPGTYIFDCLTCSTRHYLFVYPPHYSHGAIMCGWDTVSEPLTVTAMNVLKRATRGRGVRGRRSRVLERVSPQSDGRVVVLRPASDESASASSDRSTPHADRPARALPHGATVLGPGHSHELPPTRPA
jgi:hypothetical protein